MSIINGSYGSSSVQTTSSSSASSSTYTSAPDPNSLSSTAASTSRITGLSGFDVDGTVAKLMVPYQQKIDTVKQKEQVLQWQQTAYRNVISQIQNFSSNFFDITNPKNYILSQNAFNSMTVTNSDTTGSVTATATASAQPGNYTVMNVSQLATSATLTGKQLQTGLIPVNDPNFAATTTILGQPSPTKNTITIGGNSINIDSTGTPMTTVVQDINNQIAATNLSGNVSASYVNINGTDYIKFTNIGTGTYAISGNYLNTSDGSVKETLSAAINLNNLTPPVSTATQLSSISGDFNSNFSFTIQDGSNSYNVSLNNASGGTHTIGDLINQINTVSNGTLSASMDDITGQLSIQTTGNNGTGSSATIKISSDPNNVMSDLGFAINSVQSGKDAELQLKTPNGTITTMTESSNNFSLNGVNYSLNMTTAIPVSLNIAPNTQNVVNLVQNFVTQYNSLISSIETQYNAQSQQYKYPPLTSTQMKSMTQQDITNWNNQAQIGIIANDTTIGSMLNNLSNALFNPTDQTTFGINLSAIGISMNPDPTNNPGQLTLDTTALTKAVQSNPQQVMNLLIQQSSTTGTTIYDPSMSSANRQTRTQSEGVLQRISDIFNDNTTTLLNTQGNPGFLLQIAGFPGGGSEFNNTLTKQMNDINTQISTMTTDMNNQQNNYYNQFSAMEAALMQMNNQSNWLSQQLSG